LSDGGGPLGKRRKRPVSRPAVISRHRLDGVCAGFAEQALLIEPAISPLTASPPNQARHRDGDRRPDRKRTTLAQVRSNRPLAGATAPEALITRELTGAARFAGWLRRAISSRINSKS
jgi:hypothetical protein